MDVYHVAQLGDGGITIHQNADLLNDVGSMGSIGMTTYDTVFGIRKQLQHTLGLVHSQSLAVGPPEGFATVVIDTISL